MLSRPFPAKRRILLGLGLALTSAALASPAAGPVRGRGRLIWDDEFNQTVGSGPADGKWSFDLGDSGWGNRELERYTADSRNCAVVSDPEATDGKALAIIARRRDGKYTSARIKTAGKFSAVYGWFEARMKLPVGQGVWPAFWLLGDRIRKAGWPACGEIDIMENLGSDPTKLYGTLHGPGYSGDHGIQGVRRLPPPARFDTGYHLFAVHWSPGRIEWLLDGQPYHTVTPSSLPKGAAWVFDDAAFSIIVNLAIGGGWPGYPTGKDPFPQTLYMDYVRVYDLAPAREDGPAPLAGKTP